MSAKNFITISVKLRSPKGSIVEGSIVCKDGLALSVFNDPTLARTLYEAELNSGNTNVVYDEKLKAVVQLFKGFKKEQILEKIKKELKIK